jgi:hypothetical protein
MTKKFRNSRFRFLYKFHIYGGLFSSAYFIIVGITALHFNHPRVFEKTTFDEKKYEQPFAFKSKNNEMLIDHAMDSLGIFGHRPLWEQRRDKENNFYFQINRPGKQYKIVVLEKEGKLKVTERETGILQTLSGMHAASGGLRQSAVFRVWSVYAHAAVIFGLFSMGLSYYFWFKKSKLKKWQWVSVSSVFVVSVSYILFIWLVG